MNIEIGKNYVYVCPRTRNQVLVTVEDVLGSDEEEILIRSPAFRQPKKVNKKHLHNDFIPPTKLKNKQQQGLLSRTSEGYTASILGGK